MLPSVVVPEVVVEDPPRSVHVTNARVRWDRVFDAVRSQGGKWCRIGEYVGGNRSRGSAMVGYFRQAGYRADFEVVSRSVAAGTGEKAVRLYARLKVGTPA